MTDGVGVGVTYRVVPGIVMITHAVRKCWAGGDGIKGLISEGESQSIALDHGGPLRFDLHAHGPDVRGDAVEETTTRKRIKGQ